LNIHCIKFLTVNFKPDKSLNEMAVPVFRCKPWGDRARARDVF
jgi:hypothetical protein